MKDLEERLRKANFEIDVYADDIVPRLMARLSKTELELATVRQSRKRLVRLLKTIRRLAEAIA